MSLAIFLKSQILSYYASEAFFGVFDGQEYRAKNNVDMLTALIIAKTFAICNTFSQKFFQKIPQLKTITFKKAEFYWENPGKSPEIS